MCGGAEVAAQRIVKKYSGWKGWNFCGIMYSSLKISKDLPLRLSLD